MIPIAPPPVSAFITFLPKKFHQISFMGDVKMLETHKILSEFSEVSKIYRESGHNEEISKYLAKRLENVNFKVSIKDDGTICAYRGLNKAKNNAVILQAHMDIVAISADGNPKKPIEMHIKNGWLYANNRTLGADNGIGLAVMLALAADEKFKNTPLEMIITTDEETGMDGARKLSSKDFYGKYLINLDSETYGHITKGCAGISQFNVSEKIKMISLESDDFVKISLSLKGARGGHSAEVTENSLNPIKVFISLLRQIEGITQGVHLVSFIGGERYNAIPRDTSVEILVPKNKEQEILKELNLYLEKIKNDNEANNPDLNYVIYSEKAPKGTKYIDLAFQNKMLASLDSIPTGLLTVFEDSKCPKTSQNLGILKINSNGSEGSFYSQIMGRSSDKNEANVLQEKTSSILSKLFDKKISACDNTPIWQPAAHSKLEGAAVKAFIDVSSGHTPHPPHPPTIAVEHGGLESAIFAEKKPDLEQISIGPTIEEPHSIHERVKVSTVLPFYDWLCEIIELLQGK